MRIKLERDPTPPERTKRTAEHICELLDICPNSTCFQFQGKLGRENAQLCNGITTLSPHSGQAVQRQIHLPQELQFHSWTLAKTKKRKTCRKKSRKKEEWEGEEEWGFLCYPVQSVMSVLIWTWTELLWHERMVSHRWTTSPGHRRASDTPTKTTQSTGLSTLESPQTFLYLTFQPPLWCTLNINNLKFPSATEETSQVNSITSSGSAFKVQLPWQTESYERISL